MVDSDSNSKTVKFFLSNSASDATSSNSEDENSRTHYLLKHEKAKK